MYSVTIGDIDTTEYTIDCIELPVVKGCGSFTYIVFKRDKETIHIPTSEIRFWRINNG